MAVSEMRASVHALSSEGKGIAWVDGKTVFIAGALPEEIVSFRYEKHKGRYSEAVLVDILQASPDRVSPKCPHFSICGGCSLQHLEGQAQLRFKEQAVLDQLAHIGKVVPEKVLPPITGASFGYRRRARIGAKFVVKKNKFILGFHEKNHRYIADLESCDILHPKVSEKWLAIRDCLSALSAHRDIPQIEIAVGDEMTALVLRHLSPLNDIDKALLTQFGQTQQLAIYLQPKGVDSVHPLWLPEGQNELYYRLPDSDVRLHFQATDFIQINVEVNASMVNQAITLLDLQPTDSVLDLFCGLGNFTLPLAQLAKNVIGVEGSADMVKRALYNASLNNLKNVAFYTSDLEKPVLTETWAKEQYPKIILDPPRTGAKDLIPAIAKWSPSHLVYISCQPATFARDLGELVHQEGFTLAAVGVLDMFPHTTHVESMALLKRSA